MFIACMMVVIVPFLQGQDGPPRAPQGGGPRPGGGGGPGGPGGPGVQFKLLKQFDKNGNKRLETEERKAAREFLAREKAEGRGPRRPGPRGQSNNPPPEPPPVGAKIAVADVAPAGSTELYDTKLIRTFFLEFENADWEKELGDFYHTDVDVPATLTVDGKIYPEVGIHFRGASSFFTVRDGWKHSMNISMDHARSDQNLYGYKTLNLLNSHTDPTFLRSMLYYHVARQYMPAPKSSYVRLVINGESWGLYVSAQQFNTDFLKEKYGTTKGSRWKVPGSPRGRGSLAYLGDNPADYKTIYSIKSKDDPKAWARLVQLCKVLNQTPGDRLAAELEPLLDIDGALKFLALENVFINADGYWIRTSDYNLYLDEKGRFHIIPHDSNETFRSPEGPGMAGGGGGINLDPLTGSKDSEKPLISKLLAVPELRAKYLGYVKSMATDWLDWSRLEPVAAGWHKMIATEVEKDTRKLYTIEAFKNGLSGSVEDSGGRGPRGPVSLKSFADQRRSYLLEHPEVKAAALPRR